MLQDFNCSINIQEVSKLPDGLISAVGHADTAAVLGVLCSRISITLSKGDVLYVAQLIGGRLPEGSTTLPAGFTFKYLRVEVN
jgi:hypothetical protein